MLNMKYLLSSEPAQLANCLLHFFDFFFWMGGLESLLCARTINWLSQFRRCPYQVLEDSPQY